MKHHIRKHRHHYKSLTELMVLVLAAWIAEGTMALAHRELAPYYAQEDRG